MRTCLVVCATKQKAACQVAGQIANTLRLRGVAVDLECSRDITSLDGYDAVVIGAPLCHGRWRHATRAFLRRHRGALESKDVALFIPGPCGTGQAAYDRSWNRLIKMLRHLQWLDPVRIEVFPEEEGDGPAACCPSGDESRVAYWCRSFAVSMHLTDREMPHRPGIG